MSSASASKPEEPEGDQNFDADAIKELTSSHKPSLRLLPYELWEVIGKHMSQHSNESLLAFRQTCTTARILVDSLPNFCKDTWINLDNKNFHRFMEINGTTLPFRYFRLTNLARLCKLQSFPIFTSTWAERITTLHLRTLSIRSDSLMTPFLTCLNSLRHLKIDKMERDYPHSRYDIQTNLPLSLFSRLHTLCIKKWEIPAYCFIDLAEIPTKSNSEYSTEESEDSSASELEDVLKPKPEQDEKEELFSPSEYCAQLFKTLKENEKLHHFSLNLRNIPRDYVTSLIQYKRDTSMTFRFLYEESMMVFLEERFVRAVAASKDKVRMVYNSAPAEEFKSLMTVFQNELEVAQSYLCTVEYIHTSWVLRDVRPLTTPNLKGVVIYDDDKNVEFPDAVEEITYSCWGNESQIDKYFPPWPAALKTLNANMCHMMDFQWNNVLKALARGCPNLSSLAVSLWPVNTNRVFISEEENSGDSDLIRRLTNLRNLKIIINGTKPFGLTDKLLELISDLSVHRLEIDIATSKPTGSEDSEDILVGTDMTTKGLDMLRNGPIAKHLLKFVLKFPTRSEVSKNIKLAVERIQQLTTLNRRLASMEEIKKVQRDPFIIPEF